MKSITTNQTAALLLAVILAFFGVASFASADHSGAEDETESHATTTHTDDHDHDVSVTVSPIAVTVNGGDQAAKIQQLITAMQQLVVLLQHQLEHMEADEEEVHAEANHDDHE